MRKIAILLMLFLSPLILPTQVRALEDTRAVKFPYGTFLYNYGFNSTMLWAQFGSTDLVVNFWYKMTNLSTSTSTIIEEADAEVNGRQFPIYSLQIGNKNGRAFWHVFVSDIDGDDFQTGTYLDSVKIDGKWHMLSIFLSMMNRSSVFPYYGASIWQDKGILHLDPFQTGHSGKATTFHIPFALTHQWTVGAWHVETFSHFYYSGSMTENYLHSWPGDFVDFENPLRKQSGFAVVNLDTGTITPTELGQNCSGPAGWPIDQSRGVLPGLCMRGDPATFIQNQAIVLPSSMFSTYGGFLIDATDSPFARIP